MLMLKNRWHILILLFVTRTAMGFQFQTVASTAPFLQGQFAIGFAEIGTLIGLYMLPGVILALPGGLLVRRFGDQALCLVGLALMMCGGALVGLSDSYAMAFAGRLISGSGAVLLSLAVTKMTTDWFAGLEIVTAMSILLTSWPLGIALALVLQPPLATSVGWPWVMHFAATFCGLAALLIAVLYQSPTRPATAPAAPPASTLLVLPPPHELLPVLIAGLAWGLFNLGLVVFFSFVPPLLMQHGRILPDAAFLTSLALWLMLASVPVGGYLVQRSGRPDEAVILFAGLTGLALVGLVSSPSQAPFWCIALGIGFGPPAGAIMAMPGRVLQPEHRAVGLGLFMTIYYVLNAFGPVVAGFVSDQIGAAASVAFGAGLLLCIMPLVLWFRSARHKSAAISLR
jgi:predicted MFS family arabinose efflux permease